MITHITSADYIISGTQLCWGPPWDNLRGWLDRAWCSNTQSTNQHWEEDIYTLGSKTSNSQALGASGKKPKYRGGKKWEIMRSLKMIQITDCFSPGYHWLVLIQDRVDYAVTIEQKRIHMRINNALVSSLQPGPLYHILQGEGVGGRAQ